MSDNRIADIHDLLVAYKHSEVATLIVELLEMRREKWRDKLEGSENDQVRGRAKECKELLQLFS